MSNPLLEVEELAVRYGPVRAVNYASFSLERQKVLGIVGESGSGKSTLLWALTRLLPDAADITSGAAWFDGQDLLRMTPDSLRKLRGTRIAYISQDPLSALVPSLTIGEQMTDILYREALVEAREVGPCHGGAGLGQPAGPGGAHEHVPLRAVRWSAPAGLDRHGLDAAA